MYFLDEIQLNIYEPGCLSVKCNGDNGWALVHEMVNNFLPAARKGRRIYAKHATYLLVGQQQHAML